MSASPVSSRTPTPPLPRYSPSPSPREKLHLADKIVRLAKEIEFYSSILTVLEEDGEEMPALHERITHLRMLLGRSSARFEQIAPEEEVARLYRILGK